MNKLGMSMIGASVLLAGCAASPAPIKQAAAAPPPAVVAPPPVAPLPVAPPPRPAPPPVLVSVANPTYVAIPMEIVINKPIKEVWKRVGKYCDIAEWLQIAAGCKITAGVDGEFGAVRTVGSEILVGKTEYSYTYTQPVRDGRPYNLYHGTLEARPLTAKTTKMVYTLMYDNSIIPGDDAAKTAEIARRRTAFERGLANMKILAEGGTLPPPPAPATPPPAPPKP